jgi:uncharacterized protein
MSPKLWTSCPLTFLAFILAILIFDVKFAMMLERTLQTELTNLLQESPSVVIMGPRQVGKTTLALNVAVQIPCVYLDLENRLDAAKAENITTFYAENRDKLIVLDEVQRCPQIFAEIRGIIDQERRNGKKAGLFLFLGSASMELLQQSEESLAGRIAHIELHGINAMEYAANSPDATNNLWLRGGFPDSLLATTEKQSLRWRRDFIRAYVERDIPQLGPRIPAQTLERLWTMLAHSQGTVLNASQLARSLDVSGVTVSRYLDLMEDLLLVRRLQPWAADSNKRLVRAPKVYVRDSGLVHALLNLSSYNDLVGHPVVGGSWEGFVIEQLLAVVRGNSLPYYYKTAAGAEISLILEFAGGARWAIEVKRSPAPSLSKGFHIACQDIAADEKFVVYGGADTFSMWGGVTAISLIQMMQRIGKQTGH